LYYDRAVDPTLIMPINVLASEQSRATADTSDKLVIKLLNYCKTHPETKIRYHASDMILHVAGRNKTLRYKIWANVS
jgi:hypothetical protein